LFTPNERTEAVLTFNYNRQDDSSPRFLLRDTPDFPISAVNPRTKVEADACGLNLRVKHAFDSFTLQSVTSVQRNTSLPDRRLHTSIGPPA
jgi:iron complex outermembrane receptor protein